jgi:hypothetical protein
VGLSCVANAVAGAYAYFDWDATQMRMVHTPGQVQGKYAINTGVTNPIFFGFPRVNISGFTQLGGNWPKFVGPNTNTEFLDHVSYLHGKNAFKFGGEFTIVQSSAGATSNAKGRVNFKKKGTTSALENFLLGNVGGFTMQAYHQLVGQVARLRYRSRGRFHCPVTIRAAYGGGVRTPELHADSVEAPYTHAAGLTVTSWTFRADDKEMKYKSVKEEMSHFLYDLGIDALFTNNPDQFPRK